MVLFSFDKNSRTDEKHIGAAGTLQRFQYNSASLIFCERLNFFPVARNDRPGAHILRIELKIHFIHGLGETIGIIQDNDTVTQGHTAEIDSGRDRPGAIRCIYRGIVA